MVTRNSLTALTAALMLSACQQNGQSVDDADAKEAGEVEKPTVVRANDGAPSVDTGMTFEEQIDAAKADFAKRFNKSDDEFEVWEAVLVDWASGALGCPAKDMNYTMALVPGFRILIKSAGRDYHYHAKRGGEPFFCPSERVQKPASTERGAIM